MLSSTLKLKLSEVISVISNVSKSISLGGAFPPRAWIAFVLTVGASAPYCLPKDTQGLSLVDVNHYLHLLMSLICNGVLLSTVSAINFSTY